MPVAEPEVEAVVDEEAEVVMLVWAVPAPPPAALPAPPALPVCVWVIEAVCVLVRVRVTVTVLVYVVPGTKAPPPAPPLSLPNEPPDAVETGAVVGLGLHWPASAKSDKAGEARRSATESRAEREERMVADVWRWPCLG